MPLLLLWALTAHADKPRKAPPATPAGEYPLHTTEAGVTIAAQPGDVAETRPNTRMDYFHHGFMPIRVIVTNNTDKTLELDQARIHFIAADGTSVPAATDDDLQRLMFSQRALKGNRIPLPAPLPSITLHKQPVDKQILEDDDDFGFPTLIVAPHTTVDGYLYYDTKEIDDPVLEHAQLRVRRLHFNTPSDAATEVDLGEINVPLKPTPAPAKDKAGDVDKSSKDTDKR